MTENWFLIVLVVVNHNNTGIYIIKGSYVFVSISTLNDQIRGQIHCRSSHILTYVWAAHRCDVYCKSFSQLSHFVQHSGPYGMRNNNINFSWRIKAHIYWPNISSVSGNVHCQSASDTPKIYEPCFLIEFQVKRLTYTYDHSLTPLNSSKSTSPSQNWPHTLNYSNRNSYLRFAGQCLIKFKCTIRKTLIR